MNSKHKYPLFLISGLPGSGKTTLARLIAKAFNLPLIHPERPKFDRVDDIETETPKQIVVDDYMKSAAYLERHEFNGRGLVYDCSFVKSKEDAADLSAFIKKRFLDSHYVVSIRLEITVSDLMKRRSAQVIDTSTGDVFYKYQLNATKVEDGNDELEQEAVTEEAEIALSLDELLNVFPSDFDATSFSDLDIWNAFNPQTVDEDSTEGPTPEELTRRQCLHRRLNLNRLLTKPYLYEKLSDDVSARVKSFTSKDLLEFEKGVLEYASVISILEEQLLCDIHDKQKLRILAIESNLAQLFAVRQWFLLTGSRFLNVHSSPEKIEGLFVGLTPEQALSKINENYKRGEHIPRLLQSRTSGFKCPVKFTTTEESVDGSADFMVKYQHQVFFLSSEEAVNNFLKNPDLYISGCKNMVSTAESLVSPVFDTSGIDAFYYSEFPLRFCFHSYVKQNIFKKASQFYAQYKSKVYAFASESFREEFNASPHQFTGSSARIPPFKALVIAPKRGEKKLQYLKNKIPNSEFANASEGTEAIQEVLKSACNTFILIQNQDELETLRDVIERVESLLNFGDPLSAEFSIIVQNVQVFEASSSTSVFHEFLKFIQERLNPVECFGSVFRLKIESAKELLLSGAARLSEFGFLCPVKTQKNGVVAQCVGQYPLFYKEHIYFLSSTQAVDSFISDPVYYVNNAIGLETEIPRVSIIYHQKETMSCKKIAEQAALHLNAEYLNSEKLLKLVKSYAWEAEGDAILSSAKSVLLSSFIASRGFVLDADCADMIPALELWKVFDLSNGDDGFSHMRKLSILVR